MEKINLPFVYELGLKLNPLAKRIYERSERTGIWVQAVDVLGSMDVMLGRFPSLGACRTKCSEL